MIDEDLLQDESVFRVGTVAGVEGRRVRLAVDKLKNGSHLLYKGAIVRNVAVGSYVKIVKGFSEMIAKVDGEQFVKTEAQAVATDGQSTPWRARSTSAWSGFSRGSIPARRPRIPLLTMSATS